MFATREDVDAALRAERPPDKMPDLPHCLASDLRVPKTFKEAMRYQHSELWNDAVDREFFDGFDCFGELFAPTVSVSSVRLLAALASEQNLDLCHFDIQQAFVQSELGEDILMRLPQGCGRLSGLIVKLCKSLYGLKQASRHWRAHLTRERAVEDSQQRFAEELAAEYGVEWGRSVPLPVSVKLTDFDENEACADVPFRELVGSLMWMATQTRPDIANAVRAVARYCASPKMVHWKATLGVLGYVWTTSWMGITFERGVVTRMRMQVFVNADYASKATDRRSVSGGLVMCGGGCVTWFSRTQKCVTLSTTEAEYMAIADVLKEVLFLRQVWRCTLPDAGMPCIPVFEDTHGAIQIAHNPITNSNSKHIDVRHHLIRELVERKEISFTHVPTQFQHADFLAKAISKDSFALHRDFVMNLQ
ncbi:unnamed protein product [Ectocarpus sp. CCAP 1310/34]|nr:unnamed protein product [Ectocarpus sp. CCAP 1310/34]